MRASAWPTSLALAGAGKMGTAMLEGWLAGGLRGDAVHVIDPGLDPASAERFAARGVRLGAPVAAPEVFVLAVKPQVFAADPAAFAALAGRDTMVLSIVAGKTLAGLRAGLPDAGTLVRAMPNLPASVGCGATGAAAAADLPERARAMAQTLLGAVGLVEWLDETLLDAVTAVSGSGPAYVFLLAECLAAAGVAAGLPDDVALRLARATVEGAGALMRHEPHRSPSALREAVTSPGGTTAAALAVLRAPDALPDLMVAAVAAAARRAAELGG